MQPNELRALLEKTKEVAIEPVHVEVPVNNQRRTGRRGWLGPIYCPSGLIKAKVIQDGHPWVEHRVISVCGDTTYDINRKSGVLVEIDPDDLSATGQPDHLRGEIKIKGKDVMVGRGKTSIAYPHTIVVERDGKQFIHMVTSRKAIFSSWGEYELEMAKRNAEREREEEKRKKLRAPQAALMGMTYEEFEETYGGRRSSGLTLYLGADWHEPYEYDEDGNYKKDENGKRIKGSDVGVIHITLDRAKEILQILTPKQRKTLGIDGPVMDAVKDYL